MLLRIIPLAIVLVADPAHAMPVTLPQQAAVSRNAGDASTDGGQKTSVAVLWEYAPPWSRLAGTPRTPSSDTATAPTSGPGPRFQTVPRWAAAPGREIGAMQAFALSAVIPGAGQYAQGQRRWIAYAAVEVIAWIGHLERRQTGISYRKEYRDLAWTAARQVGAGPRTDPGFEYFERLAQWPRSGRWDADAGSPGVQPETDPSSYNGAIWARAVALFGGEGADPAELDGAARDRALSYYSETAYGPQYLWDWGGEEGTQLRYSNLIRASDDRFKEATILIGIIMTNHLISGIDAFLSTRIREATDERLDVHLMAWPPSRSGTPPSPLVALRLEVRR